MKKAVMLITALVVIPMVTYAESFKIKNDTGSKVSLHTGSGVTTLNNGSTTSVTCNVGKKVYTASRGTKDTFLFKISSSHCGTVV